MSNIKERIEAYGFDTCFDWELLSLVTSVKVEELQKFQSLSILEERLEMVDCTELQKHKLKALFTVARRYSKSSRGEVKTIKSPQDVFNMVYDNLRFEKREIFQCILLDTKNQIIGGKAIDVSIGSLNESIIHPRELYINAILNHASGVVFIHQHPSGNPEPSIQDIESTERLVKSGEILGIKVLDHIVIGGDSGQYVSFKERGLM